MSRRQKSKEAELYHLRGIKRELKQKIGQSMSDTGPHRVTGKCKDAQRRLAVISQIEKAIRKKSKKH